ncbi:MAG: nitroreductase family protein [Bacteroidales bacterium]|nr:nitroreductase family protein [Bacteroidales bacterium]
MKLINAIEKRQSPRAFTNQGITEEQIELLFKAASWAPSARNEQPWRYFYALRKDEKIFNSFVDCLVPGNQIWAKEAQMLILSVGRKNYKKNESPNAYFLHDVGAANSYLALQAAELGFQVHQMAGFDFDKTIETFKIIPKKYLPATFIAVGYKGDADLLPENLKIAEKAERVRKDITEFTIRIQ